MKITVELSISEGEKYSDLLQKLYNDWAVEVVQNKYLTPFPKWFHDKFGLDIVIDTVPNTVTCEDYQWLEFLMKQ